MKKKNNRVDDDFNVENVVDNQNQYVDQLDDYVDILKDQIEMSENKVSALQGEMELAQEHVNKLRDELSQKEGILDEEMQKQLRMIEEQTRQEMLKNQANTNISGVLTKNPEGVNSNGIHVDIKGINASGIKMTTYSYEVLNQQGQKIKGQIDGVSTAEVKTFLENEGFEVVKIVAMKGILNAQIGGSSVRLKMSELAFILTQLSTYLKAGIPLIDSVRILQRQSVKANQKKVFSNITYQLYKGESFSNALASQGSTFPKLLINMVKTAEMTGDLPEILDDMTEYYTSIDRTRKQAISAMAYPTIIFVFAICVLTFILVYVIPEFQGIFVANGAKLPKITTAILSISEFFTSNGLVILMALVLVLATYILCYKYSRGFKKLMQTIYMHIPVVKNIIIYKEVTQFTKTFSSLLNHNVFITDSMAILETVSQNEVYKEIINDSLNNLAKGAKLSDSFRDKWAFPIVAYEMLVTGENTGRLPMMMEYVSNYYNDLYTNAIKRVNTFIEPVMIIMLAFMVGVVVLSVIIPMFSFYGQIM